MIAVIAGTGSLPAEACRRLLATHKDFFVVTLFPENNEWELRQVVSGKAELIAQALYKPGDILQLLKEKLTTHVLFIGKVDKSNLLKHLKFDWLALKLMGSLATRGDRDVMEALLAELASHGIHTMRQDEVLDGLLVKPGILCGTVTSLLETDITLGINTAIAISEADIGQTVIVKNGMVIAVEAIEGTDACISRGLALAGDGIVICKAAHRLHNTRFDLPTLGPASVERFTPGQVLAVAWLASHTLIAQREQFVAQALQRGIALAAVEE